MTGSQSQSELMARLGRMSDDEIREILVDRDGWQADMVEGAVQEAGRRGIELKKRFQESVGPQIDEIGEFVDGEIDAKVDLKGIIRNLTASGLSENEARAFVPNHVQTVATPFLDDCRRALAISQVVCGLGIVATLVSFLLAAPGGTYIVWWGAVVFGGLRAYYALSRKDYLEQLVAEAKSMRLAPEAGQ